MSILVDGTLKSPAGNVIGNADITLTAISTSLTVLGGTPLSVKTDSEGRYSFTLHNGNFAVSISKDGNNWFSGMITVTDLTVPKSINALILQDAMKAEIPADYWTYFQTQTGILFTSFGKIDEAVTTTVSARNEAVTASGIAKESAEIAQNIADANTFYSTETDPDGTIAGLAATTNGQSFRVIIRLGDGVIVAFNYYRNTNGIAQFLTSLPNKQFVDKVNERSLATDKRTDGLRTEAESFYSFEVLDKKGRGIFFAENDGKINAPAGVKTKSLETESFSPQNIHTPIITAIEDSADNYPLAEIDIKGRVLFATDKKTGKKIYFGEPLHNHRGPLPGDFFAIGDSITANGISRSGNGPYGAYAACFNSLSWHAWAMLFSSARLRLVGASATGGFTATQILKTHLPKALAANPTFCVVMGGRNDIVQGIDIDRVTIPALKKIFLILRQAGIIPVVCTMSAHGNSSNNARRIAEHKLNNWFRSYAHKHRLPLVDLHRYTVNPETGDWIAGYNQDVSHPTSNGARAMGKALVDGLLDWTAPVYPQHADEQLLPGLSNNIISNPLFLEHDGSNPKNWNVTTAGTSRVVASGLSGNAWISRNQSSTLTIDINPGGRYALGFFVKTDGAGLFECYVLAGSGTSTSHLAGVRGWDAAITDWAYYWYEFTVADEYNKVTIVFNTGVADCSIAQIGLFEQTRI